MGFTQRKKRPHIYRDPNVPWPHETYLEQKAARSDAAAADTVIASPVRDAKALKRPSKRRRK